MMRTYILQLKKEGKTILITTHDLREAQTICDRILIMNKGKIIADESPDNLRERFKSTDSIIFKIDGVLSDEKKNKMKKMFKNLKEKNDYLVFSSYNALKDITKLNKFSEENNLKISDLKIEETSLEEVFIHLINKDSRGEGK